MSLEPPRTSPAYVSFRFAGWLVASLIAIPSVAPGDEPVHFADEPGEPDTGAASIGASPETLAEPRRDPPARYLLDRADACESSFCMPGRWFFQYGRSSTFKLDASGHESSVEHVGRQLLRVHPRLDLKTDVGRVIIEAEAVLLTGRTFGDLNTVATDALYDPDDRLDAWADPDPGDYRQFVVRWETPFFQLKLGQQASRWGLGLIANDGQDDPHDVFDVATHGDLVERVLVATAPFGLLGEKWQRLLLGGGFDVVYRDENATLTDGDLALQGVVSLIWRDVPEPSSPRRWGLTAGLYVAIRDQEDDDGDTLNVRAYDLFAKFEHRLPKKHLRLYLAGEIALLEGRTSRARLEQAPEGLDVLGLGFSLQGRVELEKLGVETRLEVGYASGDNDRNDGTSRGFKFDPDYHVGMVLFQEVLARISARSIENARDPGLVAEPAKGLELIATDGSVTNAVYVNPILRYTNDATGLGGDLGVLAAWSDAAFSDAYQTSKNGGYNTSYLGVPSDSHYLGTEVDVGLRYEYAIGDRVWLKALVQGGLFVAGKAFKDSEGADGIGVVSKVRASVELGW